MPRPSGSSDGRGGAETGVYLAVEPDELGGQGGVVIGAEVAVVVPSVAVTVNTAPPHDASLP